jgi:hypothetical protein
LWAPLSFEDDVETETPLNVHTDFNGDEKGCRVGVVVVVVSKSLLGASFSLVLLLLLALTLLLLAFVTPTSPSLLPIVEFFKLPNIGPFVVEEVVVAFANSELLLQFPESGSELARLICGKKSARAMSSRASVRR